MSAYWRDKVVLITGGSAGLGRALAKAFGEAQAKVVIVARDKERLEQAASELRSSGAEVLAIAADIQDDGDVARMMAETIARFGRLDALVNNAGRSSRGALLQTPLAEYRAQWELNFLALVRCTQAAAPHLLATRGHVINIGSLAAKSASRYIGPYATTKFPVAAFSQQLRLELADTGVHVLLVCPGPIQRDDTAPRYSTEDLPDSAKKPGGGVKLKGISPDYLVRRILIAGERRQVELVIPLKAKLLFAISQLSPALGDWILKKMT
jgi:short-subunit dehydrogenase